MPPFRITPEAADAARALLALADTTHPNDIAGYVVIHTLPEVPERPLVFGPFDDDVAARRVCREIVDGHRPDEGELGTVVVAELLRPGR